MIPSCHAPIPPPNITCGPKRAHPAEHDIQQRVPARPGCNRWRCVDLRQAGISIPDQAGWRANRDALEEQRWHRDDSASRGPSCRVRTEHDHSQCGWRPAAWRDMRSETRSASYDLAFRTAMPATAPRSIAPAAAKASPKLQVLFGANLRQAHCRGRNIADDALKRHHLRERTLFLSNCGHTTPIPRGM